MRYPWWFRFPRTVEVQVAYGRDLQIEGLERSSARGHPLYYDGLELHGTWRVKPAVAKLDDRMAYVTLDDDDEFHLFWRVDDFNVTNDGKLRLENGEPLFLGQHACSPAYAPFTPGKTADLIVGTEDGRFMYYRAEDLSLVESPIKTAP